MVTEIKEASEQAKACAESGSVPHQLIAFLKEQYLQASAARAFLHILHNRGWDSECQRIKLSMKPEVDDIFAPAEQALREGKDCQAALSVLLKRLKGRED